MAYSDITLTVCSDGLDPRAGSRWPNGDRNLPSVGSSALKVYQYSGGLDDGAILAITTDGTYHFGVPDRRWNSFSIVGDTVLKNGVADAWLPNKAVGTYFGGVTVSNTGTSNDPSSLWNAAIGVKKVSGGRGAIPSSIRGTGVEFKAATESGYVNWPTAFSDTNRVGVPGELLYATWTKKNYSNPHQSVKIAYTGLSGTFQTGSNGLPTIANGLDLTYIGERATFVGASGGGTWLGYVRYIDSATGTAYVEIDQPNTWASINWNGATVVGNVSGAAMTLSTSTYTGVGSQKDARILEAATAGHADISGILATSLLQWWCSAHDVSGTTTYNTDTNGLYTQLPVRDWYRITIWSDLRPNGSNEGKMGIIIDGQTIVANIPVGLRVKDAGQVLANWGTECSVNNGLVTDFGELVTYTDIFSVLISDSPTWAGVDHLTAEPQLLRAGKTDSLAYIAINKGAMSSVSGKYLYALSAPDTPLNTTGIQLSF